MYDSKNENQTSFNDDDYQYYNRRPVWKIILISLGVLVVAAAVYYFFLQNPKSPQDEIIDTVDTTLATKPNPVVITETVTPDTQTLETTPASGNRFHIIAGAFVIEKNANAYMEELQKKGYSPRIILKKNEYSFISLFSYPTFKEANAKYKELENQGFPIWIMKYRI